ncbi:MAG: carbohydrate ABC transporter permease [Propionibacteriaceae bacterium]|jgi:ABC-type glycerol-3-phosphate transport system permease component|nr:carbohydrate ABC transporter permease [Propionibacteriaceae bacterium]
MAVSSYRVRKRAGSTVRHIVTFAVAAMAVTPIIWIALTSLKPPGQVMSWPPSLIPEEVTLDNYRKLFATVPVGRYFLNSLVLAAMNVAFNVVCCTLAGYTLARRDFPGRKTLTMLVVAGLMIPVYVRLLPQIQIIKAMGLQNTYLGLILPTACTAFGVFLMRQFFLGTVPMELEEAAMIDGCGDWGVLLRIVVPLARPQMITLTLLAITWSLEDVLWPLMIVDSVDMRPLPIGLMFFLNDISRDWGPVTALVTIIVLPVVTIFIFLQRYFVAGMAEGAVKS